MGVEILPPIITKLRRDHPDLEIELVLSNRVENLLRRDADIGVRSFHPPNRKPDDLAQRCL
ncbi:LysR substrate-binding domain-containing protein [Thalassospira povalilytica]|uniref:LysR substrate-binding domain-containing protein n=1 Tax=Thalassospira povalilytica TaxID=732237 RepID=UPI001D198918|nr:LysR substrate-binding domain-containing protein [Thalassospira povalilytica]MCC4241435.1 hypothetical protein [Thalassospira povalilytica]